MLRPVAIALGSNLGDRENALQFAISRLTHLIPHLVVSQFIETDPEGEGLQEQPRYLNAIIVGETDLSARAILNQLLAIERAFGRERPYPNAPRTLDLDLILLGNVIEDSSDLQVPHPRFRERLFVLAPLAEIAPEMIDPVTGLTAAELQEKLRRREGNNLR
jgi:2-amino-4-hydroxy-6-hydroxymethyldihydropteridine diphosphokinase